MWTKCKKCEYHFDTEVAKENHGVVWFKGQIEGYICSDCKCEFPGMEKNI